ncbi:MAG: hypothetical protein OEP48_13835 [Betaproteobacteria bacterium]|nr:hypothetical protein [Betaproteobacteria bacterium]MDH3436867.1 hypothetical protein [Betaproteobacteria bacterium]
MRAIVIAVLMLAAVDPARALETTRQLLESGAPRLALDRVEQRQPRETADSRWGEWETLRLRALFALKRYQDVLARTGALLPHLPERELRQALALAAQSALKAGQPAQARGLVARALWQSGAVPDGGRELRLLVIESYLAEGNGHAAFRAMLRFAQDFHPLEPATAARFVDGLLVLDMAREAANWLARLDEGSPAKQMLRLKAGLIKPDAAIAQSRARLSKGGGRGHWQVIAEAAAGGGKRSVRIEALEQLVQNAGGREEAGAAAAQLWQTYHTLAQESANLNHLLVGDDAAWATYASKRLQPDPFIARAFFAYLAQRARSLEARQPAQLQLVRSLQQGKLDAVALRLFDHETIDVTAIDGQARYLLGSIAEARDEATLAVRFWEGLAIPSGMTMAEWEMRRALMYWRAGNPEGAMKALVAATSEKRSPPANAVPGAILLGQEMVAAGKPETADASLPALLLLAGTGHQRELLMALGRTAEAGGLFGRAGGYFLQAALAPGGRTPDATAPRARLAAALNLARAGYREDARAQFEWVIRHSRDPAELKVARRGLAKL